MHHPLVILSLTALLVVAAGVGAVEPDPAEVDEIFAEWDSTHSPGCALGVYRDGETAYARGYGMANLEYGIANSPRNVFRIGSTSKQFAAMAIAILAEAGELDLDDDLRQHFPELPDYGTPVTVRHLVHHTSGLRDYLTLAYLAEWSDDFSVAESVEMIARQRELNFAPGDRFLYSNSNYFLMSQLVERLTGQTLRQWAEEHIFGPLGMDDTHFHDDHTHIVSRRADGYSPREGGGFRIDKTILDHVGDGGIYTTVEDLLSWDDNFYANRLGKGTPELIERVTTPAALADGESSGYGFGLFVGDHRGVPMIHHGGAFVGYRAAMNRFPEQRLTVAVLCNLGTINPSPLALRVAELYLADALPAAPAEDSPAEDSPPSEESAEESPPSEESAEESAVIAPATFERVAGAYWKRDTLAFRRIVVRDGKLFYHRRDDSETELEPRAEGGFRMVDVPVRVAIHFEPADGPVERMVVEVEGNEPRPFERYQPAAPSAADLAAFAGTYTSPELDHTQVLTVANGALVARRDEDLTLEPALADVFVQGRYSLFFERDGEGRLTGYRLNAGRVRNLRYERDGTARREDSAAAGSPTESWRCRVATLKAGEFVHPLLCASAEEDDPPAVTMPGFSWVIDHQLAAMPQPGAERPLEEDLAFLQSQGIELLVSLTEEPTDPTALSRRGIDRLHLPVRDFTAPSLEQLHRFVAAVESSSAAGRAVGVHCTAGLGRSGTFAAAYFVARGMSAAEAVAEVRRLRPGSVETREQEERLVELAASLVEAQDGAAHAADDRSRL